MQGAYRIAALGVFSFSHLGHVSSGRVFGSGSNKKGQLGDGTRALQRMTPVEITAVHGRIRQVAASSGENPADESGYTLYLRDDGTVLASGHSDSFQLIDSLTVSAPVTVSSIGPGIAQVAAGKTHSVFLTVAGLVECTGFNAFGQLGSGPSGSSSYDRAPRAVSFAGIPGGPHIIKQVSVNQAGYHTLFLTTSGRVLATGHNEHGQLGTNDLLNRDSPTLMLSPSGATFSNASIPAEGAFTMVVAGATYSLLLDYSGAVYSVGMNDRGQLGLGDSTGRRLPVKIAALADHRIVHMAAGAKHSIFLSDTGRVFVVGDNQHGQLADGSYPLISQRSTPIELVKRHDSGMDANDGGVLCSGNTCPGSVAAGAFTSFFRTSAGQTFAAGSNEKGQLGSLPSTVSVPKLMQDLGMHVAHIAAAGAHTVFVGYECNNTSPPCSGGAECVPMQVESSVPIFSFGCRCERGWTGGNCTYIPIPEFESECDITVGGTCSQDLNECASMPCAHGECLESSTYDPNPVWYAIGEQHYVPVGEFRCHCEDNGLLGGWEGRHCDIRISANPYFWVAMGFMGCIGMIVLALCAVFLRLKSSQRFSQGKVHHSGP